MRSRSSIIGLLFASCPPKVAREVTFVVVDPIECHTLWPFAKMMANPFSEPNKVFSPFRIDRYASGTVSFVVDATVRIVASLHHLIVDSVELCSRVSMRFLEDARVCMVDARSATCSNMFVTEIPSSDGGLGSAIAFTEPDSTVVASIESNYFQVTETLSSQVYE